MKRILPILLLGLIAMSNADESIIELVENDISTINLTLQNADSYLAEHDYPKTLDLIQKDIDLTKELYEHTFDYYSFLKSDKDIFKVCDAGSLYNRFNLYGEYLSQYKSCLIEDCDELKKIETKIIFVIEQLKTDTLTCSEELAKHR